MHSSNCHVHMCTRVWDHTCTNQATCMHARFIKCARTLRHMCIHASTCALAQTHVSQRGKRINAISLFDLTLKYFLFQERKKSMKKPKKKKREEKRKKNRKKKSLPHKICTSLILRNVPFVGKTSLCSKQDTRAKVVNFFDSKRANKNVLI